MKSSSGGILLGTELPPPPLLQLLTLRMRMRLRVMVEVAGLRVGLAVDNLMALLLERIGVVEVVLRADAAGYRHTRHSKVRDPDWVGLQPERHVNWYAMGQWRKGIRVGMSLWRKYGTGERKPRVRGDGGHCGCGSCGIYWYLSRWPCGRR